MGANTKIEWADHTHNFWIGCTIAAAAKGWAPPIVRELCGVDAAPAAKAKSKARRAA